MPRHTPAVLAATPSTNAFPPEAPAMLAAVLRALIGRRVALVIDPAAAGLLAPVIEASPAAIVCIVPSPAAHDAPGASTSRANLPGSTAGRAPHADQHRVAGTLMGLPCVAPQAVAAAGATDVVICHWHDEDMLWNNRAVYVRQYLSVHRVLGSGARRRDAA